MHTKRMTWEWVTVVLCLSKIALSADPSIYVGSSDVMRPFIYVDPATNGAAIIAVRVNETIATIPVLGFMDADTFNSTPGASLYIDNVSTMPFVGVRSETSGNTITTHTTWYDPFPIVKLTGTPSDSNVVPSLSIDNRLLKARVVLGSEIGLDDDTVYLRFDMVN
ncbi:MAG: hypothetical protein LBV15_02995, partial [Planctomycetota bacterium]|nr:hypothetical protein [Planctomycetota bacterium]